MNLRVMTYNILNGGRGRETLLLEVVQTVNPDVLLLQEVYDDAFLKMLAQALQMEYFFGTGNRKRTVALLSRLPIRNVKSVHPLWPIWHNFVHAEIEYLPHQFLHVLGIHQVANLAVLFEGWRYWEARYILNYLQGHPSEKCLLAGDFNAIAPNEKVTTATMPSWLRWIIRLQGNRVYHFSIQAFLQHGFVDSFRFLNGAESGYTLPPPIPNARLDYVFVNEQFKPYLKHCWVVRTSDAADRASDHYPVVAEFELPS